MLLTPDLTSKSSGLKSNETCIFKIKRKTNNYLFKFFLDLDKEANLLAFSCKILAMFGFQKCMFKARGKGDCPRVVKYLIPGMHRIC